MILLNHCHANYLAGLFSNLKVNQTLAATVLNGVLVNGGTLTQTTFSNGKHIRIFLQAVHSHHLITRGKSDTLYTSGYAAHNTNLVLLKGNGHTIFGTQHNLLLTIGNLNTDELIILLKADGNNANLTGGIEVRQAYTLNYTHLGGHKEVLIRIVIPYLNNSTYLLILIQLQQINESCTLGGAAGLCNLISLEIIYAALVGIEQDGVMVGGNQ